MGGSQSKDEEIIITQAGNSGGLTNTPSVNEENSWSIKDVLGACVLALAIALIFAFCLGKFKKMLERKIRREIALSREQV